MSFLNKIFEKKPVPTETKVAIMVNEALNDLVGIHHIGDYEKSSLRLLMTKIATCNFTKEYPDEGDALVIENSSIHYSGRSLANLPQWWQGDPERRTFVEKMIIFSLRNDQPRSHDISQFIYGTQYSPEKNTPDGYPKFIFEQWLIEKERITPSVKTVDECYQLLYTFRQRKSEWQPKFEAALDLQKKRFAAHIGYADLPFDGAEETALNELIAAIQAHGDTLRNAQQWKESNKFDPSVLPFFQELMQKPLAFRVQCTRLLVFYRHFMGANLYSDVYKKAVNKLITPEFSYDDILNFMRFPDAPHSDLVRTLAQKQKKNAQLPSEIVLWITQSPVLDQYQKLLDAHFAALPSSGSTALTPEALMNSGFRSTVEANEYNYAHPQSRFRNIQEWVDDVLLLLSQVCEVQVLSVKHESAAGHNPWQQDVWMNYSLRFPDGKTHELRTTMTEFCAHINLLLAQSGSAYRLSCQSADMQKSSRYGSSSNLSGTHVRLVTTWLLDEFPDIFPETSADLSFFEKSTREQAPAYLKSLAELKKERVSARKSGDGTDILNDMRFAHFTETVIDKIENADAIKPLAALVLSYSAGAKPGVQWLAKVAAEQQKLGSERYVSTLLYLLDHAYRTELWYEESRLEALKGMMWALSLSPDRQSFAMIRQVIEYAYTKVPGKGPRAAGLGDTGLKIFLQSEQASAFSQLTLMRAKCKYPRFKKQLDKAIAGYCQKAGVSEQELESRNVDDFSLQEGRIEQMIGDYAAIISVEDFKADIQWLDAKGKEMKATPSALKNQYASELKNLQILHKSMQQTIAAQRQRLEGSWINNLSWTWELWEQGFLTHALMHFFAEKIIWEFDLGHEKITGMALADNLLRHDGAMPYPSPETIQQIRIWHPVTAPVAETLAWRNFLLEKQWRQPFKQAFREIYLLTDAELVSVNHSNRFAGHILKTNNLLAIAPQRGWDFVYEHYDCAFPKRYLTAWGLRVDYDLAQAPLGGVSPTGRLHFQPMQGDTTWVNLIDVPPVAFSEVMRDVDMFVAITSIGSDPNWQANGEDQQQYWRNYAYGALSETQSAEERKKILELMIPRTKIAKVARVEGNFVEVTGKFRTYKINIGSGNILMLPNDQYLCIVPAPAEVSTVQNKVWLPFEGDSLLTLILSKCFLLADDDKIKDGSILSQIRIKP